MISEQTNVSENPVLNRTTLNNWADYLGWYTSQGSLFTLLVPVNAAKRVVVHEEEKKTSERAGEDYGRDGL